MRKHFVFVGIGVIALLLSTALLQSKSGATVDYPEGYRAWPHVKSMVVQPGHPLYDLVGGMHHIYVNAKAMEAMKAGKTYPDGAVIVFDLLEAKAENNAVVEGARKLVAVMQKDAKKFAETGGWGFEGFKGDTKERAVTDAKTTCFSCHASQKAQDYVFATYRK